MLSRRSFFKNTGLAALGGAALSVVNSVFPEFRARSAQAQVEPSELASSLETVGSDLSSNVETVGSNLSSNVETVGSDLSSNVEDVGSG